jgi:glucose/arabinose dehydrogenase
LFVLEQSGKVRIVTGGQVLATPFLDISADISCCGELGLLGIAFDPQFAVNDYFYVDYTRKSDNATVIKRFQVSNDPNIAQYSSGSILLVVGQPFSNHNGGKIAFGEDGFLYIALGDGGSGGDPNNNAQNKDSLLGKILRIDVHQPDPGLDYGIPDDNPFYGALPGRDEIWSWGLRNPWRFSFDRLTGDMYIGDVGQGLWEEIDFQQDGIGGLNFGWRCYEGNHAYNLDPPCQDGLTFPVAEYSHSEGRSVTGGYVYRGSAYPHLNGYYFYADFGSGKIWTIKRDGQGIWSPVQMIIDTNVNISSFGEDEAGELFVADYSGGTIRRLAPNYPNYFPLINR